MLKNLRRHSTLIDQFLLPSFELTRFHERAPSVKPSSVMRHGRSEYENTYFTSGETLQAKEKVRVKQSARDSPWSLAQSATPIPETGRPLQGREFCPAISTANGQQADSEEVQHICQ